MNKVSDEYSYDIMIIKKGALSSLFIYFASSIVPSTYKRTISFFALDFIVIDFLKCPGNLPLPLYVTVTVPFPPGAIGALVYDGTVHPQLAIAWFITSGASPTLVKLNVHFCTGLLSENLPKL